MAYIAHRVVESDTTEVTFTHSLKRQVEDRWSCAGDSIGAGSRARRETVAGTTKEDWGSQGSWSETFPERAGGGTPVGGTELVIIDP